MHMTGAPPLLEFYRSYDQWKDEHASLRKQHYDLCQLLKWNPSNFEYGDWEGFHLQIKQQFLDFFQDWNRHQESEQRMIVPIANSCAGGSWLPVQVLAKGRMLARQFYQAYTDNAGLTGLKLKKPAEELLVAMLQVLMLQSELFRTEEESVIPAMERLIEQIEYGAL